MGKVKFSKDSREFSMFRDLWTMCQDYWDIEKDNDNYWERVAKATDEFAKEYKDVPIAMDFMLAFVKYLEEKWREPDGI